MCNNPPCLLPPLMQPRIPLAFQAARAHCRLASSFSSTRIPKFFTTGLPSRSSPSPWCPFWVSNDLPIQLHASPFPNPALSEDPSHQRCSGECLTQLGWFQQDWLPREDADLQLLNLADNTELGTALPLMVDSLHPDQTNLFSPPAIKSYTRNILSLLKSQRD